MKRDTVTDTDVSPKEDYYQLYIQKKVILSQDIDNFFSEIDPSFFSKIGFFIANSLSWIYFKEIALLIFVLLNLKFFCWNRMGKSSQKEKKMKEIIEVLISNHETLYVQSEGVKENLVPKDMKSSKTRNTKEEKVDNYAVDQESTSFIKNKKGVLGKTSKSIFNSKIKAPKSVSFICVYVGINTYYILYILGDWIKQFMTQSRFNQTLDVSKRIFL